jgi:hypothetical protein
MKKNILSIVAVMALALSLNSCKKDEASGTGYIQFVNASELSSPLDFYVSDVKKNNAALAYTQSTPYFEVSAKEQPAIVKVAANGQNVFNFNVTPQNGAYYSIYYFTQGTAVAYQDDLTAPETGKARVRFVNLNVEATKANDFGIANSTRLVKKLTAKVDSKYFDVEPNTTFSAYVADSTAVLLNIPTTVAANRIYTIVLTGQDAAGLRASVILQK